ncbi:hypothetical protein MCOR25_006488 [Pyricularia grisea]|nr:hypothetical protein MCOR25_006488 [Pyricularia grisea]
MAYLGIPKPGETHDERQTPFKYWDSRCGCELCVELSCIPLGELSKRRGILLNPTRELTGDTSPFAELSKRLTRLKDTHSGSHESFRFQIDLAFPNLTLAHYSMHVGKASEAIAAAGEAHKALGYNIDVWGLRLRPRRPARLHLRSWGASPDLAIWAFVALTRAFKVVAHALPAVAEKHVEVL